MGLNSFLFGSPAQYENVSTLLPYQSPLHRQQVKAAQGAIPQLQNYYGGLLSDNPADFEAMAAPEMRRFREDIVPGLAEQFAGMGSGGLSSSGFRNATVSAGADLSERLGALRAQLRQAGAAGLQGMANQGLQQFGQSQMTNPGSGGFLAGIAPIAGAAIGGPIGSAIGSWISGNSQQSPVANQGPSARPMAPPPAPFQAPSFQYRMGT